MHSALHYTIAHTALLCLLYLLVHHKSAITTYFAFWHYSTRRVQILIKKMHHGDNINWLHSILKHFCVGDLVVWVWTRIRYNIYLEISFIWVFWWLLRKKSVWCSSDFGLGFSDVSYKLNCFLRHVLMPSFPSFLCKLFAGDTDVPLCQLPPAFLHLHHTLLIFCTKFEGKFVPVASTNKMQLSMCSVLAWAGGRAGILTDSRQLCQPIRGKLRLCQPMTGCVCKHATSWTTESAIFKKVCDTMIGKIGELYFSILHVIR